VRTVLAVNPTYLGVEAILVEEGASLPDASGRWVFPPGTCDFAAIEREAGIPPSLVAIPGGTYKPSEPGVYLINEKMASEASEIDPFHPRNRLTVLAYRYCSERRVPGIVVEPMNTGKLLLEAEVSGLAEHRRRGVYYALPQRHAWEDSCRKLGLPLTARGITAYLGEESCVSSHIGDEVVDTSDPVLGEGPFGLTAAGTLPAGGFLAYLAERPGSELVSTLKTSAGAFGYAKTRTLPELELALSRGDEKAARAVSAMGYQVAKEIGRQAVALSGKVDIIVLCGAGVRLSALRNRIEELSRKWAEVTVYKETTPDLLIAKGTAVLRGEALKEY